MQGLKLWNGGKAINCLIHSNGLEGLVIVYNGNYTIQHCDIVKNALQGGYAFTAGYPEPGPLVEQDELHLIIQNSIFAFNGNLTENNPTGIWIADSQNFTTQNSIYFSRDFEEIYFNDTGASITRDQINMNLLGVNFGVDPEFVNMHESDFHLKPMSPAIDNGTIVEVDIDLEHNPRPVGGGYDIGCYEFANQPPVANFTYTPEHPTVNQTVIFDASFSYDPDGMIVSYDWDFGDGATASGVVVTHAYSVAGNYTVTLIITDDSGATNSTSRLITVLPPTPAVSVSTDKYEYTAGDVMLINITITNPGNEWQNVKFLWRLDIPDYNLSFTVISRSLSLPPGFKKTFVIPWRLPELRASFNASWYVALYDGVISEDTADWRYIGAKKKGGGEIAREMAELGEIERSVLHTKLIKSER